MTYKTISPIFRAYPNDLFTASGSQTIFELSQNIIGKTSILVWADGYKVAVDAYDVNGDILTIFLPPAAGTKIEVFYLNVTDTAPFAQGVTNVALVSALNGVTVSGSPITDSGTFTLGGTLGVSSGGTGLQTVPANQVLIGSGNNALAVSNIGAAGQALLSAGGTSAPAFGNVVTRLSLTSGMGLTLTPDTGIGSVTLAGVLSVPNGGTGINPEIGLNAGAILVGDGLSPIKSLPYGTAGQGLVSAGANQSPTWRTIGIVDSSFGVGSLIFGAFPAGTNATPGSSISAALTIYGLGTGAPTVLTGGTYTILGAINTTEEALVIRTA